MLSSAVACLLSKGRGCSRHIPAARLFSLLRGRLCSLLRSTLYILIVCQHHAVYHMRHGRAAPSPHLFPTGYNQLLAQLQEINLKNSPEELENTSCPNFSFLSHAAKCEPRVLWQNNDMLLLSPMTGTKYMSSGASCGNGVYLADDIQTSLGYANRWGRFFGSAFSAANAAGRDGTWSDPLAIVAICEVIDRYF